MTLRTPIVSIRVAWCVGLGCVLLLSGCKARLQSFSSNRARAQNRVQDEATIRRLDAAWVKAAETKQVDAWMAFYAEDAVVLPPNEAVATDRSSIRKSVGELLALPGLSLTWQPAHIEVAAAGDIAYLYGTYELTSEDAHGMPMTDYGKNVEIWKKQSDGSWKCIVDTWNSDLPVVPIPMESGKTEG
jgi:ketosteroid isomerase-like protein